MTVNVLIGPWMFNFHDGLEDVCSELANIHNVGIIFVLNSIPIILEDWRISFLYLFISSVSGFGDDFFHQKKIDSLPKIPKAYLRHNKNPE